MREFRHTAGALPCFGAAFYAPATFLDDPPTEPVPYAQAGVDGWPWPIEPGALQGVRCHACGARLAAADVTAHPTALTIITCADRRRPENGRQHLRLTRALLESPVDRGCVTARQLADYLNVDPRLVTAAMESGGLPAFRVGRRGGVGEWRCTWADGRHYIAQLEARVDHSAA